MKLHAAFALVLVLLWSALRAADPAATVSGTVNNIATGSDNGYNGEYPGWTMLTTANAGTAIVPELMPLTM